MLQLEEISMNAWPALQTVLYDGWILRFAEGYTKRANSVNPVYASTLDIGRKLEVCEGIFTGKQLAVTYKITPACFPADLDAELEKRGYRVVDPTSVRTMELNRLPEVEAADVQVCEEPSMEWVEEYVRMNGVSDTNRQVLQKILTAIVPRQYFLTMKQGGRPVACGMTVLENGYAGLFDIVVDPAFRGRGYGRQLVLNLLHLARSQGAERSYLQVVVNNRPAYRLYESLGFREQYRYWYRVKE